mmetsp:Transcript_14647/g.25757  ORF Transcript_14647/g.25757 Transcript_14647/m.25757 type:complete len:249 (+) Transcript_14647:129-875(+)
MSGPLGGHAGYQRRFGEKAGRRMMTKGIKPGSYVLVKYVKPARTHQDEDIADYEGTLAEKRMSSQDRESHVVLKDVLKLLDGKIVGYEQTKQVHDVFIEDCQVVEKRDQPNKVLAKEAAKEAAAAEAAEAARENASSSVMPMGDAMGMGMGMGMCGGMMGGMMPAGGGMMPACGGMMPAQMMPMGMMPMMAMSPMGMMPCMPNMGGMGMGMGMGTAGMQGMGMAGGMPGGTAAVAQGARSRSRSGRRK